MHKKYFVTGIDTGVGKTVVSAILLHVLKADYWKPIQCGDLDNSDLKCVTQLTNNNYYYHQESFRLQAPQSPNRAAALENISIRLSNLSMPQHITNSILIEGAGGALVPINEKEYIIDIAQKFDAEVIVVSKNYLGSINHTLLTLEFLKSRRIKVAAVFFIGDHQKDLESLVTNKYFVNKTINIPWTNCVNCDWVLLQAQKVLQRWQ